jgi:hypothetical protein
MLRLQALKSTPDRQDAYYCDESRLASHLFNFYTIKLLWCIYDFVVGNYIILTLTVVINKDENYESWCGPRIRSRSMTYQLGKSGCDWLFGRLERGLY